MAKVYSVGVMIKDMTATGNRIKCMVKDSCNGLMVANFQGLFLKI